MQRTARVALVAATSLGALVPAFAAVPSAAPASPLQRVVVQAASVRDAAAAVRLAGGTVTRELAIVDGVAATLPAGARLTGVTVTPDREVASASVLDGSDSSTPVSVYAQEVQAANNGGPQRSVTVAIIDTGVAPVGGLADNLLQVPDPMHQGQLAPCANFSAEDSCADSYGHGTFLAGLIAGDGPYPGLDPSARLVSVKIAGRDGAADTSQLLAAIQYVVSFKDQLGIKVLNLSLGTDSDHDARKDPLNRAVERAWQAGITVVVAASNRGHAGSAGTISKPADDPLVVTVGAVDDRGTTSRNDDTVPAFTAQGPVSEGTSADPLTVAKPDVVAPGVGLISLVAPGSHIEQTAPPSSVGVSGYRFGSGTSQATAVVSAAAAIVLERRNWTPDEVKAALVRGAYPIAGAPSTLVGAGLVSVSAALGSTVAGAAQAVPRQDAFDQDLDLTRRGVLVTSFSCTGARAAVDADDCVYVHGMLTSLAARKLQGSDLVPFDPVDYGSTPWTGQSWYSSQWMQGQSWYGQSWYGQSWYGQSWYEDSPRSTSEGTATDFGSVLPGSAWYGVWR